MRSRSRETSRYLPHHFRYNSSPSGPVVDAEGGMDPNYWFDWSSMTDSIDRTSRTHPADHTRLVWSPFDRTRWNGSGSLSWYWDETVPTVPWQIFWTKLELASALLGLPSDGVRGDLADQAFDALSDQVPQEVDIANFALDLREIGSLIPKLEENLSRTVSSGFLNYEFGWLPFISDLQKLGKLSSTVASRLDYLRRTRGKRTRIGFYRVIDLPSQALFPYIRPIPSFPGHYALNLLSSKAEFRAGGTLYHELEGLNGIEGTLRGMSAALGLTNPSAVVWERIPYSFVVDWFARTKSVTDSFKFQPFSGVWNISDVTHSFKLWFRAMQIYAEDSGRYQETGILTGSRYIRGIGLPVSSSLLNDRGLSPTQQLLAAALLYGAAHR